MKRKIKVELEVELENFDNCDLISVLQSIKNLIEANGCNYFSMTPTIEITKGEILHD